MTSVNKEQLGARAEL